MFLSRFAVRAARAPLVRVQAMSTARVLPTFYPRTASLVSRVRFYSPTSLDVDAKIVNFKDVKSQLNDKNVVLVDVREPDEYAKGHIPGALNIPFRSSPGALGLDKDEFKDTFGFDKPGKDANLIFYCQGGVRSSGAEQLAATYGYKNRENYTGSFGDWTEQKGEVTVPK